MTDRTLRGRAAIVGVADVASPTGVLELHGRALEVGDDPRGARRRRPHDRRRRRHLPRRHRRPASPSTSAIHPRFIDGTMVGGSSYELHVEHAAAAIARRACARSSSACTPRRRAATAQRGGGRRRPRHARARTRCSSGRCRTACACRWAPYALAASRHMAEYGTTSEQLAQIAVDTRRWAALNPQRPLPRPDHDRRRARVADAGVAAAPARLLPRDRRRGRVRDDVGRAGPRPAEAAGLRARRGDRAARPLDDQRDARPHDDRRRGLGRRPRSRMAGIKPDDVDLLMGYDSSPSPRCCTSRTSASAPRARAARSSRTASSARAARCR